MSARPRVKIITDADLTPDRLVINPGRVDEYRFSDWVGDHDTHFIIDVTAEALGRFAIAVAGRGGDDTFSTVPRRDGQDDFDVRFYGDEGFRPNNRKLLPGNDRMDVAAGRESHYFSGEGGDFYFVHPDDYLGKGGSHLHIDVHHDRLKMDASAGWSVIGHSFKKIDTQRDGHLVGHLNTIKLQANSDKGFDPQIVVVEQGDERDGKRPDVLIEFGSDVSAREAVTDFVRDGVGDWFLT